MCDINYMKLNSVKSIQSNNQTLECYNKFLKTKMTMNKVLMNVASS